MKCERCCHNLWSSYNPDNANWCECGINENDMLYVEDGCKLKYQETRKLARLNNDMIGKSYYGYDFLDSEGNCIPLDKMTETQKKEYLKAQEYCHKAIEEYNKYLEHLNNKYKEE